MHLVILIALCLGAVSADFKGWHSALHKLMLYNLTLEEN